MQFKENMKNKIVDQGADLSYVECPDCGNLWVKSNDKKPCPFCKAYEKWESNDWFNKCRKHFFPIRIARNIRRIRKLPVEMVWELGQNEDKNGLYIYGPNGTGKSTLASRMMLAKIKNDFIQRPFSPIPPEHSQEKPAYIFSQTATLLQEIRAGIKSEEDKESEIIKSHTEAKILVLDDIGVEKSSEYALQLLYIVLNNRYENFKPTIFTSNLSMRELEEKYGDSRLISRIRSMCSYMRTGNENLR